MSRENVEVVRRGLELFNQGKFDAVLDLFDPEIELTPGIAPLLGGETLRGREAVRRFWQEDLPQALDEFHIEPQRFEDFGEVVLVEQRYRARGPGSGMDIEQTFATVYTFEAGRIRGIHDYLSRQAAVEAVGLSK